MAEPEPAGPPTLPAGLETRRTASGLEIVDVEPGEGAEARDGLTVELHCRGWLTDGRLVEDTRAGGEAPRFTLGTGQVIPGFEEGLLGMRPGGRRRLIVPSDLGYGPGGRPPRIPPYATLIYDVELRGVEEAWAPPLG